MLGVTTGYLPAIGLFAGKDEVIGRRTGKASHTAGEEVTKDEGRTELLHGVISL
ncbi:hypothetical protein C4J95_2609 [Pseudomonas orientalis]|nr:hypothetical protein C4J95_2609 [Pseudomonas orientalis]